MTEPHKRVIVEAVEFSQLFGFPKIVKAAASALQPSRMIIALLMVTALITIGRVWDMSTSPTVSRHGLLHGRWNAQVEDAEHQAVLRNASQRYATNSSPTILSNQPLTTREVLRQVDEGYRTRRAALTTDEEREELDAEYNLTLTDIRTTGPQHVFRATASHIAVSLGQLVRGIFALSLAGVMDSLGDLVVSMPRVLWRDHTWFFVVYGLATIIITGIGGGAIARIAACQIAGERRPGIREALDFSMQHWMKFVVALALPLILLIIVRMVIAGMGLLTAAPILDLLGGLLYGFALVLGFLFAFLLVGYLAGAPMLVPAVAVENCDGSDAVQRTYAYAVSRPLHLLWYWLISIIAFGLGYLLVSAFAVIMLNSTASLYRRLSDNPALTVAGGYEPLDLSRYTSVPPMDWHERTTAGLINLWETVVICLVAAYVLSYFFSAATAMYLLMRKAADGQDPREIWQHGLMPGSMFPAQNSSSSMSGEMAAMQSSAPPQAPDGDTAEI